MSFNNYIIALGFLFATSVAYADSYRTEIGGSYMMSSYTNLDEDTIGIHGTIHFKTVEASDAPLAEQAYLAKSNNVLLRNVIEQFDGPSEDVSTYLARAEFYIPQKKFYVAPFFKYDNFDSSTEKTFGVSLGGTPIEGLLAYTTITDDGYDLNVFAKYVSKLPNGHTYNIEGGYQMAEEDEFGYQTDYFGLAGDYYIDPTLSVGGFYERTANIETYVFDGIPYADGDIIGIRSTKYFSQVLSANGSIRTGDDGNAIRIGVDYRL